MGETQVGEDAQGNQLMYGVRLTFSGIPSNAASIVVQSSWTPKQQGDEEFRLNNLLCTVTKQYREISCPTSQLKSGQGQFEALFLQGADGFNTASVSVKDATLRTLATSTVAPIMLKPGQ